VTSVKRIGATIVRVVEAPSFHCVH